MAKLTGEILDGRYSGFAAGNEGPKVVPVRMRYKWRPWRKSFVAWSVVVPKQKVIGRGVYWCWRDVATFRDESDALAFLADMG